MRCIAVVLEYLRYVHWCTHAHTCVRVPIYAYAHMFVCAHACVPVYVCMLCWNMWGVCMYVYLFMYCMPVFSDLKVNFEVLHSMDHHLINVLICGLSLVNKVLFSLDKVQLCLVIGWWCGSWKQWLFRPTEEIR